MNKKSLIIGFGDRARKVVFPALTLIGHEILIYSRDLNKLKIFQKHYKFEIIDKINTENLNNVYQIFVCTKNDSYENIIEKISKTGFAYKISLFLDTPLLFNYFKIKKYKDNFKNFVISEDETFDLINKVIKDLIKTQPKYKLFRINLNHYGLLIHSISQIMRILNLDQDNFFENKISYAIKTNFKKIKYLLKINDVKIFLNYERNWSYDESNIEIFLNSTTNYNIVKKYKIKYLFHNEIFDGFKINGEKYINDYLKRLKKNMILLTENLKNKPSRKFQIKILNFITMINFYEVKRKSNIINYVKCEYFVNILNNIKFFININIDLITFRKIIYRLKKKL